MFDTLIPFIPTIGNVIGSLLGAKGQSDANETNVELAREQMAFQERMSSSAYQRATKDMQLAGLNPMLAYSQGGASAPAGATTQVQNVAAAAANTGSAAAQSALALQQLDQSKANVEQTKATTAKIESETMEKTMNTALLAAQIKDIQMRALNTEEGIPGTRGQSMMTLEQARANLQSDTRLTNSAYELDYKRKLADTQLANLEIPKAQAEANFYKGVGEYSPYVKALLDSLKGLTGIGSTAKSLLQKPQLPTKLPTR